MRMSPVLFSLFLATPALAGESHMQHQGRLTDVLGAPLEGDHTIRVSLYADAGGTELLWRQSYDVVGMDNGYYSVNLEGLSTDGTTDLDDVAGRSVMFLGVAVDGAVDLEPRDRLAASAFGERTGMAGMVAMFAGTTCPSGWVSADGTTYTVAEHPSLHAAIGTTYGGNATSFRVPDLRGEFLRGADAGRGVDPGRTVGSTQAHDWKTFSVAGFTNGGYTHNDVTIPKVGYNTTYPFGGEWAAPGNLLRFRWDETSEIRPRNVALLTCIRT